MDIFLSDTRWINPVVDLAVRTNSKLKLMTLIVTMVASALFFGLKFSVGAQYVSEYQRYVHMYVNSGTLGNWTYIEKPVFPVILNDFQVAVGQNWSIVCPLQAALSYHVYLYGKWINNLSGNKTDYDVYVYNPDGTMESYHTSSAGLPEHLGNAPDEPFLVPKQTGNYTFTIVNDARDSAGSSQATFMIIENIECNTWYQKYMEGNDDKGLPLFNANWAYEFVAESQHVEIRVKVPSTLDVYEARLFLMAYPAQTNYTTLDGIPLAWEQGLYGNRSNNLGGYNIDSQGYEGVTYASCENYGQDMTLGFDPPHGKCLYHLVLMGESGYGNVSFLVKTVDSGLQPLHNPDRVFPDENATITYVSKSTDLRNASLQYSVDDWKTVNATAMNILDDNRTCTQIIPMQAPNALVCYRVEAVDSIGDALVATGNYSVGQLARTYLPKPMVPVFFNESQIPIGREWSIVCPLEANHSYHVYCYGEWVNLGPDPETDYDINIYDPLGEMKGYHTESAGLPEHLGTTVNDPFFVPDQTGNYTFVIVNDAIESNGTQQATFMIIEDPGCNVWHERYIEGEEDHDPFALNTRWAYELATESQFVEVYVKVPITLDMYEARLYLMADPQSQNISILNGVPLAWEPGLYGNRSGNNRVIGGYNPETKGYRGVAWASCEQYGETMFMNFTSPFLGENLYHLVLIGEVGSGKIEFLVKTEFNQTSLIPSTMPERVYPNDNVTIAYTSNSTSLEQAVLEYSTDSWKTVNELNMEIRDRTCWGSIPGQTAGTLVSFAVEANDTLEDVLAANGQFSVKQPSILNVTTSQAEVRVGENVTISGSLLPRAGNMSIIVSAFSENSSKEIECNTLEDGTFTTSFKVETVGNWIVSARFNGNDSIYQTESYQLEIRVDEPLLAKYSLYIFGGTGAATAIVIVLYIRKLRR